MAVFARYTVSPRTIAVAGTAAFFPFPKKEWTETHPHRSASGWSVDSTISSSKIRSSPPNTDISRQSAAPRVPAERISRSRRPSSRLRRDDGCPAALLAIAPLVIARTLSSRTSFPLSFSPRLSVRPVRSLAPSPDRALRSDAEEGNEPTRVLSNASPLAARCTYMRHFRPHAVSRDDSVFLSSGRHARKIRPRDSHTLRAARTHNARTRL